MFYVKKWVEVSNSILIMATQRNHLNLDGGAFIDMLYENMKTKYPQRNSRPMSAISSQSSVLDTKVGGGEGAGAGHSRLIKKNLVKI